MELYINDEWVNSDNLSIEEFGKQFKDNISYNIESITREFNKSRQMIFNLYKQINAYMDCLEVKLKVREKANE